MANLFLPTIISGGALTLTAAYSLFRNAYDRRRERKNIEKEQTVYPTASAGSPAGFIPVREKSISLSSTRFLDADGNVINPYDYQQFVVKGDSMQFCGIHDNDLIFVRRDFCLDDLKKFPTAIVIRRTDAPAEETQYKVRRAWGMCQLDECESLAESVVMSPLFRKKIASLGCYDGDKTILADFRDIRMSRFRNRNFCRANDECGNERVVVSTTFHTDEGRVRFSIHPAKDIIGIVTESFSI